VLAEQQRSANSDRVHRKKGFPWGKPFGAVMSEYETRQHLRMLAARCVLLRLGDVLLDLLFLRIVRVRLQ